MTANNPNFRNAALPLALQGVQTFIAVEELGTEVQGLARVGYIRDSNRLFPAFIELQTAAKAMSKAINDLLKSGGEYTPLSPEEFAIVDAVCNAKTTKEFVAALSGSLMPMVEDAREAGEMDDEAERLLKVIQDELRRREEAGE